MLQKAYKFWFLTGSQDLYGDECLAHVAEHSKIIVEKLNASGKLPYELVWKPTLITDALIRQGLQQYLPGATKLVIAQRVSSVQHADKIVILHNGRIQAVGTHESLLRDNEIYRELCYSQQKGGAGHEN